MTPRTALSAASAFAWAAISFADPPLDDGSDYLVGHRHPIENGPCVSTSDVLGYRQCPGFGEWGDVRASPQVTFEGGAILRHVARPISWAPRAGIAELAIASPSRMEDLVGWDARVSFGLQRYLYVGLETDMAEVAHGSVDDFDAMIGVDGALGPLVLGAELACGARRFSANGDSVYVPVLEPRLRASVWLSPWITFGGEAGTSVLEQGEWMVGVYAGLHTYAYGGLR